MQGRSALSCKAMSMARSAASVVALKAKGNCVEEIHINVLEKRLAIVLEKKRVIRKLRGAPAAVRPSGFDFHQCRSTGALSDNHLLTALLASGMLVSIEMIT